MTSKQKGKAANPPRGEDKRQDFVRLAKGRADKAVNAIRLIGNLSHRGSYDYTEADVSKIFDALEAEMKAARARFAVEGQKARRGGIEFD